jgi:hypothetical protein
MSKIGILNQVLHRFYLKCIHKLKQWVTDTKTRKTVLVNACTRSWSSVEWLCKKFFSSLNRPPSLLFSGSQRQDVVPRLRMSYVLLLLCPYVPSCHGQGELYFLLYSICPQTVNTQGTVPKFIWPQSFRFLRVGTLKSRSIFISNGKWQDISPTHFLCLSDHFQLLWDLWRVWQTLSYGSRCAVIQGGGYFEHLLWIVTKRAVKT